MRDRSSAFWLEYLPLARESYLRGIPAGPGDPMLMATYDMLKKIDAATAKAKTDGCASFDCILRHQHKRILLRFRRADGSGFQRTIRIDGLCTVDGGRPLTVDEMLDLKVCVQSMIVNHQGLRLVGALALVRRGDLVER